MIILDEFYEIITETNIIKKWSVLYKFYDIPFQMSTIINDLINQEILLEYFIDSEYINICLEINPINTNFENQISKLLWFNSLTQYGILFLIY